MLSKDASESSDEAVPEIALLAAALIPSRSSFCSRSKTRWEVLKVLRRSSWGKRRSGWSCDSQFSKFDFAGMDRYLLLEGGGSPHLVWSLTLTW